MKAIERRRPLQLPVARIEPAPMPLAPVTPPNLRQSDAADAAALSPCTSELNRAANLVQRAPEVRLERVSALKAAIAEGFYAAASAEIAGRLFESGLES